MVLLVVGAARSLYFQLSAWVCWLKVSLVESCLGSKRMNRKAKRTFHFGGLVTVIATLFIGGCQRNERDRPSIEETKAIAEEGFIYGLPLVMNYAAMYELAIDRTSPNFKAPFGVIFNEANVATYKDTAVTSPNSDTPYSILYLDLRAEPSVVSVPAVARPRYYSAQLTDGNTFNYGYIGSRSTGTEAGDYLVVGPDWKGETPPTIKKVFHSRTQLFNPADISNVVKVQSGYRAQPLSTYLQQPPPPPAPRIDFPKANAELVKANFFRFLDFALQFSPAGPEETAIRAKLARIGVGPGPPEFLIFLYFESAQGRF